MMKDHKKKLSVFRITFLINLPSHKADVNYLIRSDQARNGSIIITHYPLEDAERDKLQSVYKIINLSTRGGSI